jgi:hypothetical protein
MVLADPRHPCARLHFTPGTSPHDTMPVYYDTMPVYYDIMPVYYLKLSYLTAPQSVTSSYTPATSLANLHLPTAPHISTMQPHVTGSAP